MHSLGIVHGDTPLCALNKYDERNAGEYHCQYENSKRNAHPDIRRNVDRREDRRWNTGNDAHEDDERHAVSNSTLRYELAHPHDERGTRNEREHNNYAGERIRNLIGERDSIRRRLEEQKVSNRIDQTKAQREITRNLGDLLSACLAFLCPTSDRRDNTLHQLHDDRCSDVGHDAEREHREVRQSAACEQVKHAHGNAGLLIGGSELMEWDARYRHVGSKPVKSKDRERKQDLLAKLRHLECIND